MVTVWVKVGNTWKSGTHKGHLSFSIKLASGMKSRQANANMYTLEGKGVVTFS